MKHIIRFNDQCYKCSSSVADVQFTNHCGTFALRFLCNSLSLGCCAYCPSWLRPKWLWQCFLKIYCISKGAVTQLEICVLNLACKMFPLDLIFFICGNNRSFSFHRREGLFLLPAKRCCNH